MWKWIKKLFTPKRILPTIDKVAPKLTKGDLKKLVRQGKLQEKDIYERH
jgi:hypothetical protein|tara:strand:- start:583 stop:729 length:147 start_codon:yes stop_codon:yes gene_type:complete